MAGAAVVKYISSPGNWHRPSHLALDEGQIQLLRGAEETTHEVQPRGGSVSASGLGLKSSVVSGGYLYIYIHIITYIYIYIFIYLYIMNIYIGDIVDIHYMNI